MRALANERAVVISNDDVFAIENKMTNEQIFLIVDGLNLANYLDLLADAQLLLDTRSEVRSDARVQHSLGSTEHQVQTGWNARGTVGDYLLDNRGDGDIG